ncbi:MAG: hypothetical protein R6U25_02225, partial [Alkalispirochaeta sp.]
RRDSRVEWVLTAQEAPTQQKAPTQQEAWTEPDPGDSTTPLASAAPHASASNTSITPHAPTTSDELLASLERCRRG